MYLTSNFHPDNIYIFNNNHSSKLLKNNYSYNLTDKYTKIISILNNTNQIDTIQIIDDQKLSLNINTNWSLNKNNNIKKILLPSDNQIDLIDVNIDLNNINCICHDKTSIKNIPKITIIINNEDYIFDFKQWTGYNQTWVANNSHKEYTAYGFLYFFRTKAIFMASIYQASTSINQFNDLDIISTYHYQEMIYDEFNRINCSKLLINFDKCQILHQPLDQVINNIEIKSIYE